MALRLEQLHPAVVHFPVAALPLAVGADLLGAATGSRRLRGFARGAVAVAAAGAVASATTGLLAGEEVNVEGQSRDMLMRHRNLNAGVTVLASCMALWRARHDRPRAGYLAAGIAGTGLLAYTAYLGGKLVYEHGAGVAPAEGVYRPDAPALGRDPAGAFLGDAVADIAQGALHMVEELRQGYVLPGLVGKRNPAPGQPSPG